MAQIKKTEVRDAILEAAAQLFAASDYNRATLPKIAAAAGISTSTVYVYFKSKLEIAIAVYEPWLREQLVRVEHVLAGIEDPRERLRLLLKRVWQDIPSERNCFANNIIQAISTSVPEDGYRPSILTMLRSKIASMIYASLPAQSRSLDRCERFAHVVVMAFDGFVINQHLPPNLACEDETIDLFCDAILQAAPASHGTVRRDRDSSLRTGKA